MTGPGKLGRGVTSHGVIKDIMGEIKNTGGCNMTS